MSISGASPEFEKKTVEMVERLHAEGAITRRDPNAPSLPFAPYIEEGPPATPNPGQDLEQIRERWEGVTLGDWKYYKKFGRIVAEEKPDPDRFDSMDTEIFQAVEKDEDGIAAAASKADVAYLLSVVAEQAATIERVKKLADMKHMRGESDMAYSKTIQDEDIALVILDDGADRVEFAREIRNALNNEVSL